MEKNKFEKLEHYLRTCVPTSSNSAFIAKMLREAEIKGLAKIDWVQIVSPLYLESGDTWLPVGGNIVDIYYTKFDEDTRIYAFVSDRHATIAMLTVD